MQGTVLQLRRNVAAAPSDQSVLLDDRGRDTMRRPMSAKWLASVAGQLCAGVPEFVEQHQHRLLE
eukprot:552314-Lingulodinium_polyedra.AAC.1